MGHSVARVNEVSANTAPVRLYVQAHEWPVRVASSSVTDHVEFATWLSVVVAAAAVTWFASVGAGNRSSCPHYARTQTHTHTHTYTRQITPESMNPHA